MYISHMANTENTHTTGTTAADAEIADRIHAALKDNKMSALALAEHTGISYKTLGRSITGGTKGYRSLNVSEIEAIAEALQVRPYTLLPEAFAA